MKTKKINLIVLKPKLCDVYHMNSVTMELFSRRRYDTTIALPLSRKR